MECSPRSHPEIKSPPLNTAPIIQVTIFQASKGSLSHYWITRGIRSAGSHYLVRAAEWKIECAICFQATQILGPLKPVQSSSCSTGYVIAIHDARCYTFIPQVIRAPLSLVFRNPLILREKRLNLILRCDQFTAQHVLCKLAEIKANKDLSASLYGKFLLKWSKVDF